MTMPVYGKYRTKTLCLKDTACNGPCFISSNLWIIVCLTPYLLHHLIFFWFMVAETDFFLEYCVDSSFKSPIWMPYYFFILLEVYSSVIFTDLLDYYQA